MRPSERNAEPIASGLSFEAYLALEERSSRPHEYVMGDVYAMSGGTARHSAIATNVVVRLGVASEGTGCVVHASHMMVRPAKEVGYYPDASVHCEPYVGGVLFLERPCMVVEVTSPSTARIDRGEKAQNYRRASSLQTILIIDQNRRRVMWHHRDAAGEWIVDEVQVTGMIDVPCLGIQLTLDEIYKGVELPPLSVAEPGWGDLEEVYVTE